MFNEKIFCFNPSVPTRKDRGGQGTPQENPKWQTLWRSVLYIQQSNRNTLYTWCPGSGRLGNPSNLASVEAQKKRRQKQTLMQSGLSNLHTFVLKLKSHYLHLRGSFLLTRFSSTTRIHVLPSLLFSSLFCKPGDFCFLSPFLTRLFLSSYTRVTSENCPCP